MSEQNKATVRKINDAFLEGNFEGFLDFCAEDVTWSIVGDRTLNGKENIRQWMNSMKGEEPPKFSTVNPVIAEGDYVVARGDMTMKDKDGKTNDYSYCDVYRFSGDKIAELNSFVVKIEAKGKTSGAA